MNRRCIRRELSLAIQKQLASAGCVEHKRLSDQCGKLHRALGESSVQGDESEIESLSKGCDRCNAELEKHYNALDEADRFALDAEYVVEDENEMLANKIEMRWQYKGWPDNIGDEDAENKFIEIMRLKYVYPDYAALVGPPSEDDFIESFGLRSSGNKCLRWERKADLLLLGMFEWNGLYIAKASQATRASHKSWEICLNPDYAPTDMLGIYYQDYRGQVTKTPNRYHDDVVFLPFHQIERRWLHDYLIDCDIELGNRPIRKKFQEVSFQDHNPYNCLPDNVILKESRGRKMRCQGCGQLTTSTTSKVIRDGREKLRYCLDCLQR